MLIRLILLSIFTLNSVIVYAQSGSYDTSASEKRLCWVVGGGAAVYALSMTGLYGLWYADYPSSSFHRFNDNKEWLQMDKLGHFTTAYYTGKAGYEALQWAGIAENKAIWYGGSTGLLFLTTVEIFDGFSSEWGASPGDMLANISGTALFIGQQKLWGEQRILYKFSVHRSKYAKLRPDLLGSNWQESLLKDYNGQTYWLSFNIHSFLREKSSFPRWLNLAVGYGADGMTGGFSNATDYQGYPTPASIRYRQFYISPDIDITRLKTKKAWFKLLLQAAGFIKWPLPTIEYNTKVGWKGHWAYF